MELHPTCIPCLVDRAYEESALVFTGDEERIRALAEFISFLGTHLADHDLRTPPFYGTERARIVQRLRGVRDPHEAAKRRSNAVARSLLREARSFYEAAADQLEALVRIAAVANSMEYGVKGHAYSEDRFKREFMQTLHAPLRWDRAAVLSALRAREKILYLTDNAGEIVFDALVIEKLQSWGKEVVIAPKSAPVLNDATIEDLQVAGLATGESPCRVIPTGASIGLILEEAEPAFLEVFRDERYLVIAKGMGHYETISEFDTRADECLKGRLLYILRAKCEPVARALEVQRGDLVAHLIR
jgi:uncharacterized protein with ATP-grasp and redox domains